MVRTFASDHETREVMDPGGAITTRSTVGKPILRLYSILLSETDGSASMKPQDIVTDILVFFNLLTTTVYALSLPESVNNVCNVAI